MGKPRHYEVGSGDKALPEPRIVKREMMHWRSEAHKAARQFTTSQHRKTYGNWKEAIFEWFLNMRPYLDDFDSPHRDYTGLRDISKWVYMSDDPTPERLSDYTELLEYLMKDLGVTDIGLKRDKYEWGYEFLNGINFSMKTEDEGWRRLKMNIQHMTELLREDTDFAVYITGGNRVGKDTIAMQLCREADNRFHPSTHVAYKPDDFWDVVDLPRYSAFNLTEASDHFYVKNTMKGDQKKKKRKLKKYATNNMIMFMCDLDWYNVDKEVLNEKVVANIHLPRRGKFEFYPRDLINQFDRDSDTKETVRPSPAFTGHFPKAPGAREVDKAKNKAQHLDVPIGQVLQEKKDGGADLKLYEQYKLHENRKLEMEQEEVEEDAITVPQLVREIKADQERYLKTWGERQIVNKDLLKADFDGCDEDKARQAKAKAEADLGIGQKDD